jgi:hypothetical protein
MSQEIRLIRLQHALPVLDVGVRQIERRRRAGKLGWVYRRPGEKEAWVDVDAAAGWYARRGQPGIGRRLGEVWLHRYGAGAPLEATPK